jgi:hypothetical protein
VARRGDACVPSVISPPTRASGDLGAGVERELGSAILCHNICCVIQSYHFKPADKLTATA